MTEKVKKLLRPAIKALAQSFEKVLLNKEVGYDSLIDLICSGMNLEKTDIEKVEINFGPNEFSNQDDYYEWTSERDYEHTFSTLDQYFLLMSLHPTKQYDLLQPVEIEAYIKIHLAEPITESTKKLTYEEKIAYEKKINNRLDQISKLLKEELITNFKNINPAIEEYKYRLIKIKTNYDEMANKQFNIDKLGVKFIVKIEVQKNKI